MECLRQGLHSDEKCPVCGVSVAALRRLAAELSLSTSAGDSGTNLSVLELLGSGSGSLAVCHSGVSDSQAPPRLERAIDSRAADVLHQLANAIQVLDFHVAPLLEGRKEAGIIQDQIRSIIQSVHQLTRALNGEKRIIA